MRLRFVQLFKSFLIFPFDIILVSVVVKYYSAVFSLLTSYSQRWYIYNASRMVKE